MITINTLSCQRVDVEVCHSSKLLAPITGEFVPIQHFNDAVGKARSLNVRLKKDFERLKADYDNLHALSAVTLATTCSNEAGELTLLRKENERLKLVLEDYSVRRATLAASNRDLSEQNTRLKNALARGNADLEHSVAKLQGDLRLKGEECSDLKAMLRAETEDLNDERMRNVGLRKALSDATNPARPFQVGDIVTWGHKVHNYPIKSIQGDEACFDICGLEDLRMPLNRLTLIQAAPALMSFNPGREMALSRFPGLTFRVKSFNHETRRAKAGTVTNVTVELIAAS